MAFIYNLSDTWNDAATTWNGIKLAVTNTGADSSSKLLNLTVTGASTASFVVDKSGNLVLSGSVNKITMTAPATGATLTLADGSSFITSGAYSTTFTTTGTTTLTLPTSGTVTALGNTTTGSGSIVLATSPTLTTPNLGTPSAITLTNATGLPIAGISATGTPSVTTYLRGDGSWATLSGGGSVTSVGASFTGGLISVSGSPVTTSGTLALSVAGTSGGVPYFSSSSTWASTGALTSGALLIGGGAGAGPSATTTGTGVVTALGVNVGSAGAFVVNGGALGTPSSGTLTNATGLPISSGVSGLGTGVATFLATPSSANLASAVTDETGSGSLVFSTAPTFGTNITVGTASSSTGIVNLKGTTSGTVSLSVADAAGTWTMKLPTTAGTNGYYLQTDGAGNTTWAAGGGGGGGSPGGSNTQVQYNSSGSFAGSAAFTFNGTTTVTIGTASTTTGVLSFGNASSANLTSFQAGNASAAVTYTLPTADGSSGQFLSTNGSGTLSWASGSGSGTVNSGTANQLAYYATSTNAVSGNANATISSGALTLGQAGTAAGSVVLSGSTSGTVTVGVPATAGTTTFTLPSSNGTNNYVLTTNGSGVTSWAQVSLTAGVTGTLPVANGGTGITSFGTGVATALGNNTNGASGLAVLDGSGYLAVANGGTGLGSGTSGGVLYYSATGTLASSATLASNALVVGGGAGVAPSTITTGTGVVTALGVNTGTAGAFVVNGGALGTPSSGALTNCTSVPVNQATGTLPVANGGTGLTSGTSGGVLYYSATGTLASSAALAANSLVIGGGAGVAPSTTTTGAGILTFLGTPSSANLAAAVTDETGSGSLVFATSPTLVTPTLGVASATSINKVAITAPATSATLTIADGKTLTASNTITLAATNDSQTYTLPAATCNIGYLEVPQNSQSAAYTAVLADSGKQIFHPSTDNNARTFTIPANGSVAYPVGTVLTFINMANTVTIAITTDTMYLAGTGTTGSRTLAAYGVATAVKMTSTTWIISGTGLT